MQTYRKLSQEEIAALLAADCTAQDWQEIEVADDFCAAALRDVHFSGHCKIGSFHRDFSLPGGVVLASGIEHARLHNVEVGNDTRIASVHHYIANYRIGDRCRIEHIGTLLVDGESTFGNGVAVSVLNETGGREVRIFDGLNSHLAYMEALYRHRPRFVASLTAITDAYTASRKASVGVIGNDVVLLNTPTIDGVFIGDNAQIDGAARLSNASLLSRKEAPVQIGCGVVLDSTIVSSDSHIDDGAMMSRCFVGQACHFGHGYSASDSLFFANCQGENGEACAIFAGPYTVTHHKSTLLIAGNFSFMNAGSGSNQSNHMYKLGPIHQGTLERGAKTASDSYILWPSRVGAFSLVMGRHVTHSDTTNLPFSYLIENKSATYLVPGVNLRSVGTIRDAIKWPKRDGRHPDGRMDHINCNLLSPFTIQKMMKGLLTLENLRYSSGELSDVYSFHSTKITNSSLHKGIAYYRMAIDKFMGNSLISRLQAADGSFFIDSDEALQSRLRPDSPIGSGEWVDLSGLIAPKSEVEQLMKEVERGELSTLDAINARFAEMADNYYSYEWTWAFQHIQDVYGINPSKITREEAVGLVERWRKAVLDLDQMVQNDSRKEFDLASMTGFGADGDKEQKQLDFQEVRGAFDSDVFVNVVRQHMEKKSALADRVLAALKA